MRERGLKQRIVAKYSKRWLSLLMRERGLKHIVRRNARRPQNVAPYAGAWIETSIMAQSVCFRCVAPYAGAWIETLTLYIPTYINIVAPYAGAWIETNNASY